MAIDIGAVVQIGISLAMLGLIIWLVVSVKKWYSDPSTRPHWLMSFLLIFSPVKYNIMKDMTPVNTSNVVFVSDTGSKTANACASNCSTTANCNGFIFIQPDKCSQVRTDFSKVIMGPKPGNDTYFRQDKNSPKYGFVADSYDYAFSSNLVSQRLGSVMTVVDPFQLSNTCVQKSTSNCLGFSYTTVEPKQSWLVNTISNVESTSNVTSYVLAQLTESNWSEATF